MMRSVKQLYGKKLGETDGEIGKIKDFYFDDQNWVIRYVIADTASWLPGRMVLLSPHAFGHFYEDGDSLTVNLTRHQIEHSPSIDSQKPVSRQYEEEYYRYYGWPSYWEGDGLGGLSGLPSAPHPQLVLDEQASLGSRSRDGNDPHLRSAQSLNGYHIQTKDGEIGHLTDFIIDDENWAICYVVVETGNWFTGRLIAISPNDIERISYEDSKVFLKLTREAILAAPEYHVPPPCAAHPAAGNIRS